MFTADNARATQSAALDAKIAEAVRKAGTERKAVFNVYYEDGNMVEKAKQLSKELATRGFYTTIRDLDSMRFAEVHFSW